MSTLSGLFIVSLLVPDLDQWSDITGDRGVEGSCMDTIRGEWSCRFCGEGEMGSGDQQNNSAPMKTTRQQSGWLSHFLPLPAQWSPVLGPVCEIVPINWTRESWELGPLSSCLDLCIISAGRRHRCHCHHICHEDTNREETFTQSSETYFPFIYYLISTRECLHIYYLSIPQPSYQIPVDNYYGCQSDFISNYRPDRSSHDHMGPDGGQLSLCRYLSGCVDV